MKLFVRRITLSEDVVEKLGRFLDTVVVGGGPAGLAAAMYATRFGLSTLVITQEVGGQLTKAGLIEDYMGFQSIQGPELAKVFEDHVRKYGVPILLDVVEDIRREDTSFVVRTRDSGDFRSATVIIAVGERRRRLGVPGEEMFNAKGVSYCAPCDAPLFRGKVVAVVGGGDAAAQAALLLTEYASKIYLIHRRDKLRAQPHYQKLLRHRKIEILWNTIVKELRGDNALREAVIEDAKTGEKRVLQIDGILVEIGAEPPAEFFKKIGLETTEDGYVKVNEAMETNIPGLYAAGDCTSAMPRGFKQIQIAAAHGAIAAYSAYNYILKLRSA
ncbi:Thioredoxin reductase [Pyrobaculum oguniense TE7]|uniref:Thioredoxin reductase n=1 Tax=Pyrobaculum oguniense (strain DSM 13380 / JCM 10595 / TE7) TaxID=698757 RepID=H6Q9J1_PYROT|nr:Thioredoxin reductase [Pyrobaculum oguniense TE7]